MSRPSIGKETKLPILLEYMYSCRNLFRWMQSISGSFSTFEYFTPFRSFLHFSQLYMFSPLRSSAEKKAERQSCNRMTGPQSQPGICRNSPYIHANQPTGFV